MLPSPIGYFSGWCDPVSNKKELTSRKMCVGSQVRNECISLWRGSSSWWQDQKVILCWQSGSKVGTESRMGLKNLQTHSQLPSSSRKITSQPVSSCEASVGAHEPVGVILQSNYVRDISIENFFLQSVC